MARSKRAVAESSQVERARKKFVAWRRSRKVVSRIPDDLWKLAMDAAREVGVNQASRALGLEYYALKKRLSASVAGPVLEASSNFVEFDGSTAPPFFTQWAVEMENGSGARMRVAVRSPSGPDVVGLCRAFWGEES
jgi:hypothetical protein